MLSCAHSLDLFITTRKGKYSYNCLLFVGMFYPLFRCIFGVFTGFICAIFLTRSPDAAKESTFRMSVHNQLEVLLKLAQLQQGQNELDRSDLIVSSLVFLIKASYCHVQGGDIFYRRLPSSLRWWILQRGGVRVGYPTTLPCLGSYCDGIVQNKSLFL